MIPGRMIKNHMNHLEKAELGRPLVSLHQTHWEIHRQVLSREKPERCTYQSG